MTFKTISVVGLGYIGLPTAAVMANQGQSVIGVDVAAHVVETINSGKVHIVEPGLERVVQDVVKIGRLRATVTPEESDAFIVAVPTPFKKVAAVESPEPDLSFIRSAALMIAPVLKAGDLVILESTSPVGTTEQLSAWLADARPDLSFPQDAGENSDILVAHCPERVLPGHVLKELVSNDRVVGGMTPRCARRAVELYRLFVEGECVVTDSRTAELAKLTENSFRDVNIAFANELSLICDKMGIDVWELIRLSNRHPRVNILQPGAGVGGHCIAVDPWFIVASAPEQAKLVRQARQVNDSKPQWVVSKVNAAISGWKNDNPGKAATVACFGLSFKPDIDDLRESPALDIVNQIASRQDCRLLVVEPHIDVLPARLESALLVTIDEALETADICVLLVDHTVFRTGNKPDSSRQKLIDTRGLWEA